MRKAFLLILAFISSPSVLFAQESLIFAVDIIRHGDRTPLATIPTVDYQWAQGLGQLTADGMHQEYKLGLSFRKKYIEQTHLLPPQYEPGTIYVRSTFYDRTLMSAQSLLIGLYPPGTGPNTKDSSQPALPYAYQPVPILSAPGKYDDIIVQPVSSEERKKLEERYVFSTPEWQQKNNSLKANYPRWSQLTGIRIKNLSALQTLGDTLYIHQLYNAPLPKGLTQNEIKTIINASGWGFMARERPLPIAQSYSTKLMSHIADFLYTGSLQKSKLKYVLLSAHDATIASVLSFIGAPLETPPPYASNLNFSLYEEGSGYYLVKITYNGSPVVVPACGGNTCELQQFINMVNNARDHS